MAEKRPKRTSKSRSDGSPMSDNLSHSASMGDRKDSGHRVEFGGNKSKANDMITIEIDLTNPEDLIRKMEMINLTEEETDQLLAQALEINKKLRKQLSKQQGKGGGPAMTRSASFFVSAPAAPSSLPPLKPKSSTGRPGSQVHSAPKSSKNRTSEARPSKSLSSAYGSPSSSAHKKQMSRGSPPAQKAAASKSK